MNKMFDCIKKWTLPIAMATGVCSYIIYANVDALHIYGSALRSAASCLQPALIFTILYISLCKVEPRRLRPSRLHLSLVTMQLLPALLAALLVILLPVSKWTVLLECIMICFICPTATAATVVTARLKGDVNVVTTYICLANVVAALFMSFLIPFLPESENHTHEVWQSFMEISSRVLPTLLIPLAAAFLTRRYIPRLSQWLGRRSNLAFYLWAVALSLAMAMTARALARSSASLTLIACIAAVSLACCAIQFYVGRRLGKKCGHPVSAAQGLGQKNTILAIWIGYTYMNPLTALAGGFYSVWHNVVNSWQLYRQRDNNL